MDFTSPGYQVTINGQVVRLQDLPVDTWERIASMTGKTWLDCYYQPLADLSVCKLVFSEAAASIGVNPADVLDKATVPTLMAMFDTASDDLPTEVTDGFPQQGDDS